MNGALVNQLTLRKMSATPEDRAQLLDKARQHLADAQRELEERKAAEDAAYRARNAADDALWAAEDSGDSDAISAAEAALDSAWEVFENACAAVTSTIDKIEYFEGWVKALEGAPA